MALGRPVLAQLLVPKPTCENGEKSSATANPGASPSLRHIGRVVFLL